MLGQQGRADPMVPYSESQDLAVAASQARVSLFPIDDIGHVEFTAVNVANAWKIWQGIVALLEERRSFQRRRAQAANPSSRPEPRAARRSGETFSPRFAGYS